MKLTQVLAFAVCHSLLAEGRPLFFDTLGSMASSGINALIAPVNLATGVATGLAATGMHALSGTAGVATGVVTGLANTGVDTFKNIQNGPSGVAGAMAGGLALTGIDALSGGMGVAEGVATDLANTGSDAADTVQEAYTPVRDLAVNGWTKGKKLLLLSKMGLKNPAIMKRMMQKMG